MKLFIHEITSSGKAVNGIELTYIKFINSISGEGTLEIPKHDDRLRVTKDQVFFVSPLNMEICISCDAAADNLRKFKGARPVIGL